MQHCECISHIKPLWYIEVKLIHMYIQMRLKVVSSVICLFLRLANNRRNGQMTHITQLLNTTNISLEIVDLYDSKGGAMAS